MYFFFFFNDTATTEIYTLSLHDALPIFRQGELLRQRHGRDVLQDPEIRGRLADHLLHSPTSRPGHWPLHRRVLRSRPDRKSTRLNSSHANISYAVFCLQKKKIAFVTHSY